MSKPPFLDIGLAAIRALDFSSGDLSREYFRDQPDNTNARSSADRP